MAKKEPKKTGKAVPDKHWEMLYSPSKPSANAEATECSDFVPKNPTHRKKLYNKINEQDH